MGWALQFAGEILLEVGVGGDLITKARKVVVESGVARLDDHGKQLNNIINMTVTYLKWVKEAVPGGKLAEPYITATAFLSIIIKGTQLHYTNQSTLAPKILEVNPGYYHNNIQAIYPQRSGGGGADSDW